MKKKALVLGIVFILLFSTPVATLDGSQPQTKTVPKIGIYYYPWYVTPWSINHENCPDTPLKGQYDSSNLSVIIQHLNWFEDLGVNFIIFSWWGKDSPSDTNTALIVNQIAENYTNIQYFIMVEPFAQDGPYNFTEIYDYIYDRFVFGYSANYFELDGKPAIGFYNGPNGNIPADLADDRFTTRRIGCNSSDDWEYQVPDPSLSSQPVCKDGEISVCPRYNNSVWHEDISYSEGLYDTQWSNAIYQANQGRAKIITIISWNEFAERTQIEPTIDTTSNFYRNNYYLFDKTKVYIRSLTAPYAAVEDAVSFLTHSQYNESLQLCREAPIVAPNTYWLVSDNIWAWKALSTAAACNLSNSAEAVTIAGKIKAKLSQLSAQYTLVTDSNGLPTGYSHETVLGDPVFPPYRTVTNHTLLINQYVLNTTIRDGHVINNWDQYADLLLYASLSCHWTGNDSEATGYLNDAARMWNSTAQGIQDIAFKGTYDTYKLALLLYTAEVLGEKLPFEAQLVNRIYMQQNQTSGGIITDYTANGSTVGDSNTETTSIAIVALLTFPTMTSPSPPKPPIELPIWVIVSLPVMLAIAMFVAFRVMREKRANDNCWNA